MSALYRMAFSAHKQVDIGPGDRVIISASPIPGNENSISKVINELFRKGADVVYKALADVHVSGHACQEELKMMLALTRPKYFVPVHGEYRHLQQHARLAEQVGVNPKNIFISDLGKVLEFSDKGAKFNGTVPAGRVLVDGLGVGDVGSVVLRDRRLLAEDGLIVVVLTLSAEDSAVLSGPDIVTRGFVYAKEAEDLIEQLRQQALDTVEDCLDNRITDWATIKSSIRSALSEYLFKKTRRSPMILPVLMEA